MNIYAFLTGVLVGVAIALIVTERAKPKADEFWPTFERERHGPGSPSCPCGCRE